VRFELPPEVCPGGTPNGIAWDEEERLFYLTGQSCAEIWKARFR
jgi:sugar lactone lactonase YvrE